jgi:hypothetical protein
MDFEDIPYINKVAAYLNINKYLKAKGKDSVRNFLVSNSTIKPLKANKVEIFYGVSENQNQKDPHGMGQMDQDNEGNQIMFRYG